MRPDLPFGFLHFTKSQRTAILVLVAAGTALLIGKDYLVRRFWPTVHPDYSAEYAVFQQELDTWIAGEIATADSIARERAARREAYSKRKSSRRTNRLPKNKSRNSRAEVYAVDTAYPLPGPRSLNPNKVSRQQLLRISLPRKTADQWLNYLQAGGRFRQTSDISKLYSISDTTFERISRYFIDSSLYIHPQETIRRPVADTNAERSAPPDAVPAARAEINTATYEELLALRGIGEYYAERLIEYREQLGGIVSLDQLEDMQRIRPEAQETFRAVLTVDTSYIRPLYINKLNARELARHPYLSYAVARTVVDYRTNHGPFRSVEEVAETVVLRGEKLARLQPYLSFEE